MKDERVLFRVPADAESLLAAIATLQDYVLQRVKEINLSITIQNPVPEHDYLFGDVPMIEEISHNCSPVPRGEYELVYEFSADKAYEVAKSTKAHITEVFGHQVGCVPASVPSLEKLLPKDLQIVDKVAILSVGLFDDITPLVENWSVPCELVEWSTTSQVLAEESFKKIASYSVVVGWQSAATYAAAALNRNVVEIYPTTMHKEWLSKWMADNYRMVYTSSPIPSALAKVVEETWRTRKIPVPVSV